MVAINRDAITTPSALGHARHWVCHEDKVPYGANGKSGWNLAENWFSLEEAKKRLGSNGYDGLGFIVARESGRKDKQILGGDLDNCRDPVTGEGSAWALNILKKLNTSSAASYSGCGYRFFCYGKLPNNLNEVVGHGPDDLGDETKERIMIAKPEVRAKLEKYGPSEVWNGFELYEDGPKHLTITDQWLPDYPNELQHRNAEVLEVIAPFVPKDEEAAPKGKVTPNGIGNRFPSLSVLDVIDTAGFTSEGDELVGPNPATGSSTGKNLKVNPAKNTWCNFHNEIKKGGDAWIYLACECGAIRWEDAGSGALADSVIVLKTFEHAIKRGLFTAEELDYHPIVEPIESAPAETIEGTCNVQTLLETFKKWLYIEEDYNIIGPSAETMANFCPGDPDIVGIIGPSGSIKTELIRSLGESQNEFVYPVSSITEHTLVSGHKESKDLIPQLKGRLLTIKDFTSILAKDEQVRSQIFADFREFTDGYLRKEWGNGISKEYRDIHSSILFASTNAIERYYSMHANLGQRMIFLRPKNDSEKSRERAFQNRGKQKEMRQELHIVMQRFISSTKAKIDKSGLPFTPEEVQVSMGKVYDFLAIARTPIHRDYRTDDIDEIPESEFPTRICNTVSRLCEVHALFFGREEVGLEDVAFGQRIILDNIPTRRWQILKVMTFGWLTTSAIAKKADMSTGAAKRVLDELISLKMVERLTREEKSEGMDKRSDSFKISDKWLGIVEELRGGIVEDSIADSERNIPINKER